MDRTPTENVEALQQLLDSIAHTENGELTVTDQETLREEVIDQLAYDSIFGNPAVKSMSKNFIWHISQYMGTPYSTPGRILQCFDRDGVTDFSIPTVSVYGMPFELICSVMDAGNEMEVGPLLFVTDITQPDQSDFQAAVLCAAIKKNWQAPVLFTHFSDNLPENTYEINWKHLLFKESEQFNRDDQLHVLENLTNTDPDKLSQDDLFLLCRQPSQVWEPFLEDFFDVVCETFEELDVNETFAMLKRYEIPSKVLTSIFKCT